MTAGKLQSVRSALSGSSAGRGLTVAAGVLSLVIVTAVLGTALWSSALADRAAFQERRASAESAARLIATQTDLMLRNDDLAGVRRQMLDMQSAGFTGGSRVTLAGIGVIASTDPQEIGVMNVPPTWSGVQTVPDNTKKSTVVRVPFEVSGRGAGLAEVTFDRPNSSFDGVAARAGGIALAGLLGLWIAVTRVRRGFAALGAIGSSLNSVGTGERRADVLRVAESFGPMAAAWNALLAERDEQDRAIAEHATLQATAEGAGESGGVTAACDALTHGLVVVNCDGVVAYANGAAGVLLARNRSEIIDAASDAVFEDPGLREVVREAFAGSSPVRRTLEIARGEPGRDPDAELRLTVRSAESGSERYATVLIEDITQQRLADRSRNAFVAQATHELRTPLTNIRLYVEQAVDEGDDDPQLRAQALNVINSEARRLERIVADMLSVAEIEAGSLKIRTGDMRTDQLFADLREDYAAQASEKTIDLVFDLPPKLPVMRADRDRMGQALHNIVGNALKYTPPGGKVTVRVDAPDNGGLIVAVSDTGIGIDPEECERIFERFYRANDRRIAHVTGSGLGLALAREIVRLHGGDITVESQIDEGSTFTITLPGSEESGGAKRAA